MTNADHAFSNRDPPGLEPLRDATMIQLSGTKRKRRYDEEPSSKTTSCRRRRLDPPAECDPPPTDRQRETYHHAPATGAALQRSSHGSGRIVQPTATTPAAASMLTRQQPQHVTPEALSASNGAKTPNATQCTTTEWTQTRLHTDARDTAAPPPSPSTRPFVLELPDDWSPTSQQHLEHDLQCIRDRYTVIKVIGVGAFGCVLLASSVKGVLVALKWMDTSANAATVTLMETEKRFLSACIDVPGVIQYQGSLTTTSDALRGSFLVLDYCPGQDLTQVINDQGPPTEGRCREILRQLLRSLQVMHDRNILHRDIKPGNVMVHEDENENEVVVTIVDLGICCTIPPGMTLRGKAGSEGYSAPEIWDESNPYYAQGYDWKADMYSVGCLVYTMLQGRVYQPSSSASENDLWRGMSFVARDFVRNLTQPNPKLRMTAEEAQLHPFVVGNGIAPAAGMVKRWAEQFCTENATYIGIGAAFLVAAKFS